MWSVGIDPGSVMEVESSAQQVEPLIADTDPVGLGLLAEYRQVLTRQIGRRICGQIVVEAEVDDILAVIEQRIRKSLY